MGRSVDRTPNQHGDVMTKPEEPKTIVRLSVVLLFSVLLATAYGATPVGKTHTKDTYTQLCPNGKRGANCFTTANIQLTWDHPAERIDDSVMPFTEISHYVVSMQRDSGPVVMITVAKKTSFNLKFMPSGTYTFAIATVDSDRLRGPFSDSIQVTIN